MSKNYGGKYSLRERKNSWALLDEDRKVIAHIKKNSKGYHEIHSGDNNYNKNEPDIRFNETGEVVMELN